MSTRAVLLLLFVGSAYASYCGQTAIPFTFQSLRSGQPVLGCARPRCFGWAANGTAGESASFYRVHGKEDGYMRKTDSLTGGSSDISSCSLSFGSTSCGIGQWVGGIAPQADIKTKMLMRCCSYAPLLQSEDRGIATVKPGQLVVGGEVTVDNQVVAFDYVSDIVKTIKEDGSIEYNVGIRRMRCFDSPAVEPISTVREQTHIAQPSDKSLQQVTEVQPAPQQPAARSADIQTVGKPQRVALTPPAAGGQPQPRHVEESPATAQPQQPQQQQPAQQYSNQYGQQQQPQFGGAPQTQFGQNSQAFGAPLFNPLAPMHPQYNMFAMPQMPQMGLPMYGVGTQTGYGLQPQQGQQSQVLFGGNQLYGPPQQQQQQQQNTIQGPQQQVAAPQTQQPQPQPQQPQQPQQQQPLMGQQVPMGFANQLPQQQFNQQPQQVVMPTLPPLPKLEDLPKLNIPSIEEVENAIPPVEKAILTTVARFFGVL